MHSSSENCIDIAHDLLNETTNKDITIERSHRDGGKMHGKDRHMLVKKIFTKTKMYVVKNDKQALRGKSVYVIDDLTR